MTRVTVNDPSAIGVYQQLQDITEAEQMKDVVTNALRLLTYFTSLQAPGSRFFFRRSDGSEETFPLTLEQDYGPAQQVKPGSVITLTLSQESAQRLQQAREVLRADSLEAVVAAAGPMYRTQIREFEAGSCIFHEPPGAQPQLLDIFGNDAAHQKSTAQRARATP